MTLGIVLSIVFALGWVPFFLFRAEDVRVALPAYPKGERSWVTMTPVALSLHMTVACVSISRLVQIPAWSVVLGLAMCGAAVAFWFWGRVMIGPLGVRRLPDEPPLQLQRTGAFGIVRHPLYFGYLLAAAAPLAVVLRPVQLVTFAASFIALAVRASQEERRLRAQLGPAYDAYCAEVKRLIPFVW